MSKKNNSLILYGFIVVVFIMIYFRSTSFDLGLDNFIVYINNYDNGFGSAGLVGFIWSLLDRLVGTDLMTYVWTYRISKIMLIVYYICFLLLIVVAVKRTKEENKNDTVILSCALIALTGSMFCNIVTLGSYDMYMSIIMLLSLIVLISGKVLFFVPVLSLIGIMIHPSYMIKCMPIILVLLFCTDTYRQGKKVGIVTLIGSLILFVTSEVFAFIRPIDSQHVLELGRRMTEDGGPFGEDVADRAAAAVSSFIIDWTDITDISLNLILFVVVLIPFIIITVKVLRRAREADDKKPDGLYVIMCVAGLITIIELFIKADYVFVMYYIIMYYGALLMYMISTDDKRFVVSFKDTITTLREKVPVAAALLVCPMILIPMAR